MLHGVSAQADVLLDASYQLCSTVGHSLSATMLRSQVLRRRLPLSLLIRNARHRTISLAGQ